MRRLESQRGGLVTEPDLETLRQASKRDLQAEIEPLKRDINWIKWIGGIGFTALLTVMLYLHSDTKEEMNQRFTKMEAEMKEIKQLLLQRGQR